MLVARRREISLIRLVPTTLVAFLGWALLSAFWSTDADADRSGAGSRAAALALIAVTIGHVRDTLQTVRALGDVLRVLLTLSLGLEILSGILLDTPLALPRNPGEHRPAGAHPGRLRHEEPARASPRSSR